MSPRTISHTPNEEEIVEPEYCPACGNPSVLVIRWPDQEGVERRRGGGGR